MRKSYWRDGAFFVAGTFLGGWVLGMIGGLIGGIAGKGKG